MVPSIGIDSVTPLWGKTLAPLINNSSITWTSSPNTEILSILDHFPILDFHPIIDLFTQELSPISTPSNKAEFCNRTPFPITQLGPIETLGPIKQPFPILAEGSFLFILRFELVF